MRQLAFILSVFCLLVTPAAASYITIGDYNWDVTKSSSIDIVVTITGGEQIDSAVLGFAVGDGGPDVGGLETILIGSIGDGAGTIWTGKTMSTVPAYDLPSGAANLVNANLVTSAHESVSANGELMTITLTAPVGGLTSRIGQELTLDPNLMELSAVGYQGNSVNATFGVGHVTLTPEPSTALMLLSLGGVLLGWHCCRSLRSPKS